jgi:hypothetical protein
MNAVHLNYQKRTLCAASQQRQHTVPAVSTVNADSSFSYDAFATKVNPNDSRSRALSEGILLHGVMLLLARWCPPILCVKSSLLFKKNLRSRTIIEVIYVTLSET